MRVAFPLFSLGCLVFSAAIFVFTAEADAQQPAELRIGEIPVTKVLFLGNSITLHGPAPSIGWTGNWGMAASAAEKDYVHLLTQRIAAEAGDRPRVMVKNIADFERRLTDYDVRQELRQELAFEPDLVIIALGENAPTPKTDEEEMRFATAFADLLAAFQQQPRSPTVLVRSQFWQDATKDRLMKKASQDAGAIFVDISELGSKPENYARSERTIEHAGVAGHPGDRGMQALADALWDTIEREAKRRQ